MALRELKSNAGEETRMRGGRNSMPEGTRVSCPKSVMSMPGHGVWTLPGRSRGADLRVQRRTRSVGSSFLVFGFCSSRAGFHCVAVKKRPLFTLWQGGPVWLTTRPRRESFWSCPGHFDVCSSRAGFCCGAIKRPVFRLWQGGGAFSTTRPSSRQFNLMPRTRCT